MSAAKKKVLLADDTLFFRTALSEILEGEGCQVLQAEDGRAALEQAQAELASLDLLIIGGMFTIFGIVALILASIGLYAVMAFSVSRRTAEVGIRMALGADGRRIMGLILKQGTVPLGIGLVVGLMLAVGLGRALSTFLYDVSATDPLTFVVVPIVLALVSLVALLVPASRAAAIAPVIALREE